jgi:hypothetical protein
MSASQASARSEPRNLQTPVVPCSTSRDGHCWSLIDQRGPQYGAQGSEVPPRFRVVSRCHKTEVGTSGTFGTCSSTNACARVISHMYFTCVDVTRMGKGSGGSEVPFWSEGATL